MILLLLFTSLLVAQEPLKPIELKPRLELKKVDPLEVQNANDFTVLKKVQGQWTVVGGDENIRNHMEGYPHFVDTSGKTNRELFDLHDAHHNQIGPVTKTQIDSYYEQQIDSCPPGGCPTSSYSTSYSTSYYVYRRPALTFFRKFRIRFLQNRINRLQSRLRFIR